MSLNEKLLDAEGHAITPQEISRRIIAFGNGYNDAVKDIIDDSKVLDDDGIVFIKCASRILSSFKMTRSGPFHGNRRLTTLPSVYNAMAMDARPQTYEIEKNRT